MNLINVYYQQAGQKKLKKPNRQGKGGHLGCSEGFNFNIYKKHLTPKINSQGREQMHSILNNCAVSLKQMNYKNYMSFVRVFFGLNNLKNRQEHKSS